MKVFFHPDFLDSYTRDPAAEKGRLEAILEALGDAWPILAPEPASREQIALAHTAGHMAEVEAEGLHGIAALAAGGALAAAREGLTSPAFALIRPPGHHASADSSWGFCFYNNLAVALLNLHREGAIKSAYVLDFDLHFGDGTVNILGNLPWVRILNPSSHLRKDYLAEVEADLKAHPADIVAVSAGFDNHVEDWGDVLETGDYRTLGRLAREAASRGGGGLFAALEGGYNHAVLGKNVLAFLNGISEG